MKTKYLDGSAKHAGAAVLKTLFLTPDISFNIDLGLIASWTKKTDKLLGKWYSALNRLNQPHLAPPSPIFGKKNMVKTGRCD